MGGRHLDRTLVVRPPHLRLGAPAPLASPLALAGTRLHHGLHGPRLLLELHTHTQGARRPVISVHGERLGAV